MMHQLQITLVLLVLGISGPTEGQPPPPNAYAYVHPNRAQPANYPPPANQNPYYTYQAPNRGQPNYAPPNYPPPNYQSPNYPPPNYQSPNYPPPNYQSPYSPPPNYQSPNYPPPNYQSPNYPPPNYQPPYSPPPTFPLLLSSIDPSIIIIAAILGLLFICIFKKIADSKQQIEFLQDDHQALQKNMAVTTQAQGRINENVNQTIESEREQVNGKLKKIGEEQRSLEAHVCTAMKNQEAINYQNGRYFESIRENIVDLDKRHTGFAWEISNRVVGIEAQQSVLQEEVSRRANPPGFFATIGGFFDGAFMGPPPNPRRLRGPPQRQIHM